MTKEDWLINIENAARDVSKTVGSSAVSFVLNKYNASNIDELSENDYPLAWDELNLMSEEY